MNFVRYFQNHGDVHLLYLNKESKDQDISGPFHKEYCIQPSDGSRNVSIHYGNYSWRGFRDKLTRLAERRPTLLTEWTPWATKEIVSLLIREKYDLILCRYIYSSYPLFRLPFAIRKRIVIDFDDFNSDANLFTPSKHENNFFKKIKWFIERNLILNYQRRCLSFGAISVCSKNDMDVLSFHSNSENINGSIVPNTYPSSFLPAKIFINNGYNNRNILLFVGTLNYGPNIKGLEWFLDKIFPHIHNRYTDTKFLIVGRDPKREFVSLCKKIPGVELHANVPDVGYFYDRCGIVVVPILSGGGTRIKILEAAMAGKPVFSTPFGAYGLDVTDGEDIMMFNGREDFVERFQRISEKETYLKIKYNLKRIVEMNYSPEAFSDGMEKIMIQVSKYNKPVME
jgi:glycosyltransferase involved in cell wall biosynthesis